MARSTSKQTVAAFDFDGTVTYIDSFFVFLLVSVNAFRLIFGMLRLFPTFIGYLLGRMTRPMVKERLLTEFFAGVPQEELDRLAERYALGALNRIVRPQARDRIQWHQQHGHACYLVSASFEFYLLPWAKQQGMTGVIASRYEVEEGKITGKLKGVNCRGSEKVRRLTQELGDLDHLCLYAYGDSDGDREMLAAADHAFYRKMQ